MPDRPKFDAIEASVNQTVLVANAEDGKVYLQQQKKNMIKVRIYQ